MLKECNDAVLINDGLDPQLVLFYQVWRELTETKPSIHISINPLTL